MPVHCIFTILCKQFTWQDYIYQNAMTKFVFTSDGFHILFIWLLCFNVDHWASTYDDKMSIGLRKLVI